MEIHFELEDAQKLYWAYRKIVSKGIDSPQDIEEMNYWEGICDELARARYER